MSSLCCSAIHILYSSADIYLAVMSIFNQSSGFLTGLILCGQDCVLYCRPLLCQNNWVGHCLCFLIKGLLLLRAEIQNPNQQSTTRVDRNVYCIVFLRCVKTTGAWSLFSDKGPSFATSRNPKSASAINYLCGQDCLLHCLPPLCQNNWGIVFVF